MFLLSVLSEFGQKVSEHSGSLATVGKKKEEIDTM